MWEIIRYGETSCDEVKRCEVMHELAKRAGLDFLVVRSDRGLSLMNPDEIQRLAQEGVDIQLHTHRHCLPDEEELVKQEISQNRQFLEPLTGKKCD